jgi:biotin transport system substrate-specific component
MYSTPLNHPTLADTLWKDQSLLRTIVLAVAGSILLYISAKIRVPFYPVPITMQTFVVLLIGFVYGWKLGAATILLYLVEGAAGLPVFSGSPERGIGVAYMMGPTGGYLTGFVLAAGLCGWLAERGWDRHWLTTLAALVMGNLVIYALGLAWLGSVVGWDKPVLDYGLFPFLYGDLFKVILATLAFPVAWKIIRK